MFFSARPVRFCDAISLVKTGKFLLKFKIIVIVTMSCVLSPESQVDYRVWIRNAESTRVEMSQFENSSKLHFLKSKHIYNFYTWIAKLRVKELVSRSRKGTHE